MSALTPVLLTPVFFLAHRPARCTLAYWHHPLYSSGGHGSKPKMRGAWELRYRAGADTILSGHAPARCAPPDRGNSACHSL
jgi:hypothetical protein